MLAKIIYVKYEEDGDGYLLADYAPRDLVDTDDEDGTEIGEYKLVRKAKYTLVMEEIK